jgi:nucleotide-binding universal stress UspA family protein
MAAGIDGHSLEVHPSSIEVNVMFKTIVVGVDGREGGRDALALAKRVEDLAGGELVAVHISPYEPFPMPDMRLDVEAIGSEEAAALFRDQMLQAGIEARALVAAETSPARGLHRVADALGADLVVVGGSHRGPIGRVVAGDTVRAVLHGAARPVLVAPHGTPESAAALAWAGRFAQAAGGTVRVLCVAEPPQGFSPSISYGINWVALAPDGRDHAEELVAQAVAALHGATGEAVVGHAFEELERLSEEVDLLVLGSRGYGPVRRTLLGSTSDRVIHHAACPVVVIPRGAEVQPDAESAAPAEAAIG